MMFKIKKSKIIMVGFSICALLIVVSTSGVANAQDSEKPQKSKKEPNVITPNMVPSLFFTYWQHQAITDAKNSRGVVRPPSQAELDAMAKGEDFEPDIGPREIYLSGIVYKNAEDWVIWLNGKRITPGAVPKEVMDLSVFDKYIELKWLDDYKNSIYPIRLQPHQRFNLDTRIFLMGEH